MQDIIGTGLYSSEYVVASKNIFDKFRLTGGLGWGRLGTKNKVYKADNRVSKTGGTFGGLLRTKQLFRGDVGVFGGIEHQALDGKLTFKAEISSDDYSFDKTLIKKLPKTDINYGINYKLNDSINISSYYAHNETVGLQLSLKAVPSEIYGGNFLEPIPEPFYSSPYENDETYWEKVYENLKTEKIIPLAYKEDKNEVTIIISNRHYSTDTQAIGRVLRVLSKYIPLSIKQFTVILSEKDIPILSISMDRYKVAEVIDAPNSEILTKKIVTISDTGTNVEDAIEFERDNLTWALSSYYRLHLFDPDKPLYYDLGPELHVSYKLKPGFFINANIQDSMISTFDEIYRGTKGSLPKVRTDSANYLNIQDTRINELSLVSYYKPKKYVW